MLEQLCCILSLKATPLMHLACAPKRALKMLQLLRMETPDPLPCTMLHSMAASQREPTPAYTSPSARTVCGVQPHFVQHWYHSCKLAPCPACQAGLTW
jgi:hypothetical protein